MGDKYIKKDDDGKEYLYEDNGFGGLLDRKIGEVRETDFIERAFGASDSRVRSDDFLSNESYSLDRDRNPLGGTLGIPEYSSTQVTDDETEETSSFEYDWRVDGDRYSERKGHGDDKGARTSLDSERFDAASSSHGAYSAGGSASGSRAQASRSSDTSGIGGGLVVVVVIGVIVAIVFSMFGQRSGPTSETLQAQPPAPTPIEPRPIPRVQILNALTAAGADANGNPVGITDTFYGNDTYYSGTPEDDRYGGSVIVFVDYAGDLPLDAWGEMHIRLINDRGASLGVRRCKPRAVNSLGQRFYCEGNASFYTLLPGRYEIQMHLIPDSWVSLSSFSVRPRNEKPKTNMDPTTPQEIVEPLKEEETVGKSEVEIEEGAQLESEAASRELATPCREYTAGNIHGTVCRQSDGSWKAVSQTANAGSIEALMDESDRYKLQSLLENNRTNHSTSWQNIETGYRYTAFPTRTFSAQNSDVPCREYAISRFKGNAETQESGTACRSPYGVWR